MAIYLKKIALIDLHLDRSKGNALFATPGYHWTSYVK